MSNEKHSPKGEQEQGQNEQDNFNSYHETYKLALMDYLPEDEAENFLEDLGY